MVDIKEELYLHMTIIQLQSILKISENDIWILELKMRPIIHLCSLVQLGC